MYDKATNFQIDPPAVAPEQLDAATKILEQIETDLKGFTEGENQKAFYEMVGDPRRVESPREKKERELILQFTEWIVDTTDLDTNNLGNDVRALFLGRLPDKDRAIILTRWFAAFLNEKNIYVRDYVPKAMGESKE